MKAAIYTRYGSPEVVTIRDTDRPTPGAGEVLIRVTAAGVTTADWRLRAAAFPGVVNKIAGRLMFGVFKPRNPVLGGDYAGEVAALGAGVTDFAPGDRVFGFTWLGAHAEYLVVKADGPIVKTPDGLTDEAAAALPFGGVCALEFLGRFVGVKTGERVLIVGASGGVGVYAVQIAKALGAEVTAVASGANAGLVQGLGADRMVDYTRTDPAELTGPYDVVFDTVGVLDYPKAAPMLARGGRFVPLNFMLVDMWRGRKARRNGHRQVLKINTDSREALERLKAMIAAGHLRPVLDTVYPMADIRAAYSHVESRRRKGAVVLRVASRVAALRAA